MATIWGYRAIAGAAGRGKCGRAASDRRKRFLCCLLAMVGVVVPAYAADGADGVGASSAGGYYGEFYNPGDVPAASATVPPEAVATAPGRAEAGVSAEPRSFVAPDAGGLAYQPGFTSCAAPTYNRVGALAVRRPSTLGRDRYLTFGVTVAETYTDNVRLAADENAESAWITEVVPSINACASAGRVKVSFDYQLQALLYSNDSDLNAIYHNVSAATTAEIVPGHLFLAADTSYGQTVIDPSSTFSSSNVLRPGNRTSAWTTNISPYWFQRLGRVGQGTLRYRYGHTEYGSSSVSDYTLHGFYLNLSNPPTNTRWSYQLSAASQRVEHDDDNAVSGRAVADDDGVTHYDSATLRVGYRVTDSLQVFATGGAENDYHADGSVDRFGSVIWDVGFRWASPNSALEAHYGERSFGSSWSIEALHHTGRFDLALTYSEDTTGAGLNGLNRGTFAGLGSFRGRPIASPIGFQGVYVSKRLEATIAFATARTRTTLQAYDESREFLTRDLPDEDVYGVDLNVSYQPGPRTSVAPHAAWEHRQSDQSESEVGEVGIGVNYVLTQSSQVAVDYTHSWRDAESDANSYDENRVTAQYSIFF